jgi:hypothetical protein
MPIQALKTLNQAFHMLECTDKKTFVLELSLYEYSPVKLLVLHFPYGTFLLLWLLGGFLDISACSESHLISLKEKEHLLYACYCQNIGLS